jgi:ribosomal protein S6
MSEQTMPAAEAASSNFDERNSYELAFHVLPTAAEGEVPGVFDEIKAHIKKHAETMDEEAPERVDLMYPIVKQIEGKNRKFNSAYFGWVRFKAESEKVEAIMEEISGMQAILRHLLIKLTASEEAHPFRFHEHRKTVRIVETAGDEAEVLDESHVEVEENVEVSETALDESLEKITNEEEKK